MASIGKPPAKVIAAARFPSAVIQTISCPNIRLRIV
jgi:hypothetical protein